MRLVLLGILSILLAVSVFSQEEYNIQFDKKPNFENLYFFPDFENKRSYWLEMGGSFLTEKTFSSFKVLNHETQKIESRSIGFSLSTTGKFLRVYYYDEHFWFVNHDIAVNSVSIIPISVNASETKKTEYEPINITLDPKERVYVTHHRDGEVFILSKGAKAHYLKVHTVGLTSGDVSTIGQILEKADSRAFKRAFNPEGGPMVGVGNGIVSAGVAVGGIVSPPRIVDYSKHNNISSFTDNEKVFFDGDEVVLMIEHMNTYIISLYHFNIKTGATKKTRHRITQTNGWNSFNATYLNKKLYRIMANNFGTYFDIIDTETEKTIFSKGYDKKSDYPFDFQQSTAVNQSAMISNDKKMILKKLGRNVSFIYPDYTQDSLKIYMGSIRYPMYDDNKSIANKLKMERGLGNLSYPDTDYNLHNRPITNVLFAERDLTYMLIETNIDENGTLQKDAPFKNVISPDYIKRRASIINTETFSESMNVAVYRYENRYYGVFWSKSNKRILFKRLEY